MLHNEGENSGQNTSNENQKVKNELKEWIISIVVAVVLALLIRQYVVEPYMVDGPSMQPTLYNGERLVVNKFIYHWQQPQRGDVIVFRFPKDPSRDFIKRVIAVGGDKVEIKNNQVFVNDVAIDEPYIAQPTHGTYPATYVPQGKIFVLGDNRGNSEDSRYSDVGFVPLENVKGKAAFIVWPLDKMGKIR